MNIKKIMSTILVIIWMFTIFYFSHQQGTGSSSTSKKVSMTIVNIFDIKNEMQDEEKQEIVEKIEPVIRKLAHFGLYMIGGILLINCTYTYKTNIKTASINASIIGVLYSASDEIHQLFVNGRSGKIIDVIIDSLGIFTGIVFYLIIITIIKLIVDKHRDKIEGGE